MKFNNGNEDLPKKKNSGRMLGHLFHPVVVVIRLQ